MKKLSVLVIAAILCFVMASTSFASIVQPRQPAQQQEVSLEEPVSTTGTLYGYQGIFDRNTASAEAITLSEGAWDLNDAQMLVWEGTAIQNSGSSSLVVRNSYIRGETSQATAPLEGNPGNLLVAGNIRTSLALENSENIYLNSTIITRNWAALSTDGAKPALAEGQKELSLYAYGSEAIAVNGGYGGYSDLFCNLYSFGSHFQSAEIGIISGTYGNVTIGTIEDGENQPEVAAVLSQADREMRSDKQLGSVIEGGRNALMIHSVNLPPYWEYEGYSQEEIPWRHVLIKAHGSTLRTDLSLERSVTYEPQKQAYINHTKGSVILIKSTNAELYLDGCEIVPAHGGTGYLIQTVYNNDTMFMNAVPDGTSYPGIMIDMRNMDLKGDIAHEDYQRDLYLTLTATTITGGMNEYDCAHWNLTGAAEGFTDYCLDEKYATHHGLQLTLTGGSVWNVTGESTLSRLYISEDSQVIGTIYVDGVQQPNVPGTIYEGKIVVQRGEPEKETVAEPGQESLVKPRGETSTDPSAEPESATSIDLGFEPDPEASKGPEEHVHNWVYNGGVPATCTEDGVVYYICSICGAEYYEYTEALGHDWVYDPHESVYALCTTDGYYYYYCDNPGCTATYTEVWPATGHGWALVESQPATCGTDGYNRYECTHYACIEEYTEVIPATGEHNWVYEYTVPSTCTSDGADYFVCSECGATYGAKIMMHIHRHYEQGYGDGTGETMGHVWVCDECGAILEFFKHIMQDGVCVVCGYSGPVG